MKGSQKIRDGSYGAGGNSDLARNKTDDAKNKIQDGSYGAVEHRHFAQNKTDVKGDKEGTIHGDYTLNQSPSAREVGLTKETQGEYLLQIPGGTVKVFYFLCFLLDPGPIIVYASQSLTH